MDSEQWKRVDNLFQAALATPPPARQELLRQACAGDETLEREVRSLLAWQQEAGSFLESPPIEVAARDIAQADLAGQTISHYQKYNPLRGAKGFTASYHQQQVATSVFPGPTVWSDGTGASLPPPPLRHGEPVTLCRRYGAKAGGTRRLVVRSKA